MIQKEKNGVVWFEFLLLQKFPHIRHGVFSRIGGISTGNFSSLNFGLTSGDTEYNVQENKKRALIALGDGKIPNTLTQGLHVHGIEIHQIDDTTQQYICLKDCDGFTTKTPNIALMITHADCQAALFYDPRNNVLANVHCGWRGNVQNIYKQCVDFMKKHYTSKTEDLIVCISPSLGPNKSEFIHYANELPEEFLPFQVSPTYFNLWDISKYQLQQLGIPDSHIEIAKICTYSEEEFFFSYRRKKISGRNATIAWLT